VYKGEKLGQLQETLFISAMKNRNFACVPTQIADQNT
jgi:hypothetical protein